MYKLYYDTIPGNKLLLSELTTKVKTFKYGIWRQTMVIQDIMSLLGIKYKWTNDINDPEAIVIVEVESQTPDALHRIIRIASRRFRKCIVVSTTEAPNLETISMLPTFKYRFSNVLLLFLGNPKLNFDSSNIIFYPFFLIKPFVFDMTLESHNFRDCNHLTTKKDCVFNHLSKNWSQDKYHTHYTILRHLNRKDEKIEDSAMLSYRPITYTENPERKNIEIKDFSQLESTNYARSLKESTGRYERFYPNRDYVECANPNNPNSFPPMRLNIYTDDPMYDDSGNIRLSVGSTDLRHPSCIYTNSYISLVTENGPCFFDSNYFSEGLGFSEKNPNPETVCAYNQNIPETRAYNHVISEKTVQPILNGHIFIVGNPDMGNGKYHTNFLKNIIGLELFEEVFDYKSLENDSRYLFTYNVISQLNEFRKEVIFDNAKIIAEKLCYNKDLMINPNGELRQKLKKWFVEDILNKFLKLNP